MTSYLNSLIKFGRRYLETFGRIDGIFASRNIKRK